jgi:hypothetical protein
MSLQHKVADFFSKKRVWASRFQTLVNITQIFLMTGIYSLVDAFIFEPYGAYFRGGVVLVVSGVMSFLFNAFFWLSLMSKNATGRLNLRVDSLTLKPTTPQTFLVKRMWSKFSEIHFVNTKRSLEWLKMEDAALLESVVTHFESDFSFTIEKDTQKTTDVSAESVINFLSSEPVCNKAAKAMKTYEGWEKDNIEVNGHTAVVVTLIQYYRNLLLSQGFVDNPSMSIEDLSHILNELFAVAKVGVDGVLQERQKSKDSEKQSILDIIHSKKADKERVLMGMAQLPESPELEKLKEAMADKELPSSVSARVVEVVEDASKGWGEYNDDARTAFLDACAKVAERAQTGDNDDDDENSKLILQSRVIKSILD